MGTYLFDLFLNPKGTLKVMPFRIARIINTTAFVMVGASVAATSKELVFTKPFMLLSTLALFITLYSVYVVDSKRLADIGRSRKFAFIGIIGMMVPPYPILSAIRTVIFFLYLIWLSGTPSVLPIEEVEKTNSVPKEAEVSVEDLEKTISALEKTLTRTDITEGRREFMEDILKDLKRMYEIAKRGEKIND